MDSYVLADIYNEQLFKPWNYSNVYSMNAWKKIMYQLTGLSSKEITQHYYETLQTNGHQS